jgi:hypothetical protein
MNIEKRKSVFTGSVGSILGVLPALILAGTVKQAQPDTDSLAVGRFSAATPGDSLPEGWTHLTFKKIERHTRYRLVQDNGRVAVKAVSGQSASGLSKNTRIDPEKYPVIDWQWKVGNILSTGDVSKKQGDDCPARPYITFEYDGSRVGFLDRLKYKALRSLLGRYPPLGALS